MKKLEELCSIVMTIRLHGFTIVVFQSQWETIKEDLVRVFQEFARDGTIRGLTSETYICLIPKKVNSCKVKEFRSISLVTSLYNIIS